MPKFDDKGHWSGFLSIEEKEGSDKFDRRFFVLNTDENAFQYFYDDPQNMLDGAKVTAVGTFRLPYISMVNDHVKSKGKQDNLFVITSKGRNHNLKAENKADKNQWIELLRDATKITVPKRESDSSTRSITSNDRESLIGSYTTEIAGGVVVRTKVEVSDDSSGDELEKGLSIYSGKTVLKSGFLVKQGAVRKNWKKRYFVLDEVGLSYFRNQQDKNPIKTIGRDDMIEARESIGIHITKENIFELVTYQRVYYIQASTPAERDQWISTLNKYLITKSNVQKVGGENGEGSNKSEEPRNSKTSLSIKPSDCTDRAEDTSYI